MIHVFFHSAAKNPSSLDRPMMTPLPLHFSRAGTSFKTSDIRHHIPLQFSLPDSFMYF